MCSLTWTLIGRTEATENETRIHQYIGARPRWACSGWTSTVPVLSRETRGDQRSHAYLPRRGSPNGSAWERCRCTATSMTRTTWSTQSPNRCSAVWRCPRERPTAGGSGRRLRACTAGQRARSPALSRILADRGLAVGPVFDQLEQVRAILRAAGFSTTDAVRAFYTLLTYVFGFVMWELPHVHQQPAAAYAGAWITALDHLDSDAYPTLHELRDTLTTTASSDQFEYGLAHLVGSLRPERGQRQRSSGS
jgi:Tetracyclin repressor-like, C-terminal domain